MMTSWEDIAGEKCADCGGYATHHYGNVPVCCQCHGGNMITQEEAKAEHEREKERGKWRRDSQR
jgi:hypothetical protein